MKRYPLYILLIVLLVATGRPVSGEKGTVIKAPEVSSAGVIVINPKGILKEKNWGEVVSGRELYAWGRSMGLYLLPDLGPLKDNRAAPVHRDGTVISLKNLDPGESYTLFLDPVAFRNPDNIIVSSRLEVSVRCQGLREHLLADLRFSEMTGKALLAMRIPYVYSHRGSIEIVLRERSNRKVTWAIWDIIVVAGDKLPPVVKDKKYQMIKNRVAKKKAVKKKIPAKKKKSTTVKKKKKVRREKKVIKKKPAAEKKKEKKKSPGIEKKPLKKKAVKEKKEAVKKKSDTGKKEPQKKSPVTKKKVIKKNTSEKKLEIRRPSEK